MAGLLAGLLLATGVARADDSLVLGILADRDPAAVRAHYRPLAAYLEAQLPGIGLVLEVLDLEAIDRAVAHRRLDLVITMPNHYLELRSHSSLTGPLATQLRLAGDTAVSALGGVMIARAERADIATLADLRGQRVAVPGRRFLGGFQAQAFELAQQGLVAERDLVLHEVGGHDAVVADVLAGEADVGFVRTGMLESLARQGRLELDQVKVLNPQRLAGYPYVASTRLYPEWLLLALPHVELATKQRLAAVLLALTPGHAVTRVAGIAGFEPPQDTLPVEDLLTALKAPPFDRSPPTSWQALWEQNRRYLVSLAAGLLVVLTLLVELARRNRRLRRQRERTRLANSVFYHTHEGIMVTSPDGRLLEVNPAFTEITGYSREEALGQAANLLRSGRHEPAFYAELWDTLGERGQWAGEVWNRHKSGRIYPQRLTISAVRDDDGLVECYVGLLADISSLKTYQQELERIAHYDPLTALPNRALLADRLRQAMAVSRRRNRRLAVVFIDLDGFKAVNDVQGHHAGDLLLVELARRMQGVLREGDTLARLGGDEFVAVVTDLATPADCHPVLERLLEVAATAVVIDGVALEISASLGVALTPVALEVDADQLLRQADQAMYRAKRQGKNRYACAEALPDKCLAV